MWGFVSQKKDKVKLSQQQEKVSEGAVPMPIYTAINSRRDVSAQWFAGKLCFTGNPRYIYQYTSNHNYYVCLTVSALLCFRMGWIYSLWDRYGQVWHIHEDRIVWKQILLRKTCWEISRISAVLPSRFVINVFLSNLQKCFYFQLFSCN